MFLKTHSFYTFKEPKIGTSLILCGLQWTVINDLLCSRSYLTGHIVLFLTGFPICICTFDQSTITSLNQQIFCETHQSKLHWNPNLFLFWWPCSHQQFNRASVHFSHSTSYSRPYGIESDKRQIVYTLVLKIMLEKTFEVGLQFIMKDWSSVWFLDFWKFSLIGSMFSFGMQTPSLE